MTRPANLRLAAVALATAALGAGLCACKPGINPAEAQTAPPPLAALPMTDAAAPQGAFAPKADRLPPARPAPVRYGLRPEDEYAYMDRAWGLNDAFYDAPPDYAFAYDDVDPWVWESDDRFVRVAEPLDDGYRYYYYEPGAPEPFLIRDPDYAYGFSGGALTIVYDSRGRALPYDAAAGRADIAGRYLSRAEALYAASRQARRPVARQQWGERRVQFAQDAARLASLEQGQQAWRSYHESHARQEDVHWAPERYRRAAEAARFAGDAHDAGAAARDLRAAREAQDRARQAGLQVAGAEAARRNLPAGVGPLPPSRQTLLAGDADRRQQQQARLEAERQAQVRSQQEQQARLQTEHQAQVQARQQQQQQQQQAKLQSEHQAQVQGRQEQQAKLQSEHNAQVQARQEQQAKLQSQHNAQVQARQDQQAKLQSEHNAQVQARQEQQAKLQSEHNAQVQARQDQQAKLQSEHQADVAKAQQARQQAEAQRKAQVAQAQAQKNQPKPSNKDDKARKDREG